MWDFILRWLIKHFISEMKSLLLGHLFSSNLSALLKETHIDYYLLFIFFMTFSKIKRKTHVKAISPCSFWLKSIFSLLLAAVKTNTTVSVNSIVCQVGYLSVLSPARISTEDYQQPIITAVLLSTKCHLCIWHFTKQHSENKAPVSSSLELI